MELTLLPRCRALISQVLDSLRAGSSGHDAVMFHVNLTSIDDPEATVQGYRGGSLTSLDAAASAAGVPFRGGGPIFHATVMQTLSACVEAGLPLYLLRVLFARSEAQWSVTSTVTQTIAQRTQLLGERASLDARLRSTLLSQLTTEGTEARLRWSRSPGQLPKLSATVVADDRTQHSVASSAATTELLAELEAFYRASGFGLDSLAARLSRTHGLALTVDDYYG